jgi:putative membrane protein
MNERDHVLTRFWSDACALTASASLRVLPNVLIFWGLAWLVYLIQRFTAFDVRIELGPHEVAGALLGILLVLRTNAGYDRWWEARKAWGGIINQSRNLAITALTCGPADPDWRQQIVRWTAAFSVAARARLRGERSVPELEKLLGKKAADEVAAADHGPTRVSLHIARLLNEACARHGMDRMAFLQADRARATLIDHLGVCERILNTPLPRVYAISIRRFIFLYLGSLPFALLHKLEAEWMTPLLTLVVAFPILDLDQIGIELQNPFSTHSLSHLPLDTFCATIERNLLALQEV